MHTRVAIAQITPSILDVQTGAERAAAAIREAAAEGAGLVAFAESWLGGYPAWAFAHAEWDDPTGRGLYGELLDSSVVIDRAPAGLEVPADALGPIRRAARDTGTVVVMGMNERPGPHSGTVYNSLVTIGDRGEVRNVHRKTTPTLTEKLVHAPGDAAGIRAIDTAAGRVGGLICWEHWSPLARAAAHATDAQIHVAAWPDFPESHALATRSYAFEGRTFVLAAAQYLPIDAVPERLRASFAAGAGAEPGAPFFAGGSAIAAPDGTWLLEPQFDTEGIFVHDLDLDTIAPAHYDLDVTGHYARPDLFELRVHDRRAASVTRTGGEPDALGTAGGAAR